MEQLSGDAEREIVDRMKDGRGYIAIGCDSHKLDELKGRAMRELRNDNALLRQALAECAIPLEVMDALNSDWKHWRLMHWWRKLVSPDLRNQIHRGVIACRETARDIR